MKNITRNVLIAGTASVLMFVGSAALALSSSGVNTNMTPGKVNVNPDTRLKSPVSTPSAGAKTTSEGHAITPN